MAAGYSSWAGQEILIGGLRKYGYYHISRRIFAEIISAYLSLKRREASAFSDDPTNGPKRVQDAVARKSRGGQDACGQAGNGIIHSWTSAGNLERYDASECDVIATLSSSSCW